MLKKIRKKKFKALCKLLLGGVAFVGSMFMNQDTLNAMPVPNPDDVRNNVTINGNNITGSGNGFQSWIDFSLAKGEILNFSGMNNMLNYVPFKNPSLIYGTINAPDVKNFYIINPSGILFGPDSKVVTGDLFVSTRSLTENEISTYISGGSISNFGSIDASRINNGGLKSSDIMGVYDIADGDVMFLGKVQANSLKVEGNTIQIRNTKDIKTKDGTNLLDADKIELYSNNPVEVGYEVTTDDVEVELTNPFPFDFTPVTSDTDSEAQAAAKKEAFIEKIAAFYDIPYYDEDSFSDLKIFCNFYFNKIDEMSSATKTEKLIAAYALDALIRQDIFISDWKTLSTTYKKSNGETITYNKNIKVYEVDVNSRGYDDATAKFNSLYTDILETAKTNYNTLYNYNGGLNPKYKYFVANILGDENMPNSANKLGWTAKTLSGGTQTITDYRLVEDADDLQNINASKGSTKYSFLPMEWLDGGSSGLYLENFEGKIQGNYMLGADIDLSTKSNFLPLGYSMTYKDYATESDLINFNGLNFTIKNLDLSNSNYSDVGLFSVFSGTIKNLRLGRVGKLLK